MNRDEVSTKIEWCEGKRVEFVNYTDDIIDRAFGILESPVTTKELYSFLEGRCFPESRFDKKRLLKSLDVAFYEPFDIVRRTHGVMFDDVYWVRFEGEENLTYEEVRKEFGI